MSQSKVKAYRKLIRKETVQSHRAIIMDYINKLCLSPVEERRKYMAKVMQGINPHTGKKVKG